MEYRPIHAEQRSPKYNLSTFHTQAAAAVQKAVQHGLCCLYLLSEVKKESFGEEEEEEEEEAGRLGLSAVGGM